MKMPNKKILAVAVASAFAGAASAATITIPNTIAATPAYASQIAPGTGVALTNVNQIVGLTGWGWSSGTAVFIRYDLSSGKFTANPAAMQLGIAGSNTVNANATSTLSAGGAGAANAIYQITSSDSNSTTAGSNAMLTLAGVTATSTAGDITITQNIYDTSSEHIVAAVAQQSRKAAKGRHIIVVAENEPQLARIVKPRENGGYGCDAMWNDDFHHTAMVTLTGRREAHYADYLGSPQELISSVKRGYLYQGQYYMWQEKRRGTPALSIEPAKFVYYLQNHDQVANSAYGLRYQHLTAPGRYRAMTALLLLAPETPLLFQGQEFGASTPFLYFSDMPAPTADQVREGRSQFLSQFRSLAQSEMRHLLPNPGDPETFHRCKLDPSERQKHVKHYMLFCDLIKIRREDPVFRSQRVGGVDGAILAPEAFLLRFFGEEDDDRLILFNFGKDTELEPSPEPLLAPPQDRYWKLMWSSEDPAYGGTGTPPPEDEDGIWRVLGEAAVVLKAVKENSLVER